VEDVAEAVARALQWSDGQTARFECAGPRVYSYEELVETIARAAGLERTLMPMPFAAWHALARLAELCPARRSNQVELMETPGLAELGISPPSIEDVLQEIVRGH
jgi:NADH dehydrogenase